MRTGKSSRFLCLLFVCGLCCSSARAQAVRETPGKAAFLKSFVLPGWGQYDLGMRNTTIAFLTTEAAILGSMLALRSYGSATRTNYEALAAAHAGVGGEHPHDFYVDVGNWMNTDQFNERRLQERDFEALYTAPEDRWQWDSDEHRARMKELRIASDRAYQSIVYAGGALVLNHVFSAIHAGRQAARLRNTEGRTSQVQKWQVSFRPATFREGAKLGIIWSF